MKISCGREYGGYIKSDGDIQFVGVEGDVMHGERVQCPTKHSHSKDCAQTLVDVRPVLTPATTDAAGKPVPEVLGPSPRERIQAWFDAYAKLPEDPVQVDMPQKSIQVQNDKGALVSRTVDDGDLS